MMSVMLKHPRREHLEDPMKKSWEHPMISYLLNFPCGFRKLFVGRFTIVELQQVRFFRTKIAMEKDGSEYHGIFLPNGIFVGKNLRSSVVQSTEFGEVLM